jgi:hypothetical protein
LPAPAGPTDVVYRFLYLPTLPAGHQCADRAPRQYPHDRQPDRGLGGGYDPKGLAWTRTVRLPLPAWDSLELALAAAHCPLTYSEVLEEFLRSELAHHS